jgi:hypothetical protein
MCYSHSIYFYAMDINFTYYKTIKNLQMKIIFTIIVWELTKYIFYKLIND